MPDRWSVLQLQQGDLRLTLLPDIGGRLWDVSIQGRSLLFQNPDLDGVEVTTPGSPICLHALHNLAFHFGEARRHGSPRTRLGKTALRFPCWTAAPIRSLLEPALAST